MLYDMIKNYKDPIELYGITPPKIGTTRERIVEIASGQIERIKNLHLDGLVIYDIFDEESRTPIERPFPFIETVDAAEYATNELSQLTIPKIIYRAVGKYTETDLTDFLENSNSQNNLTVFVGAASSKQEISLSIGDAYSVYQHSLNKCPLGGVVIPERHTVKGDEHLRLLHKQERGCSFFISQGVYNVDASKNVLSDYYYTSRESGATLPPIVFTFTPCGSLKTLQFMKWLGISLPKWLENDLRYSQDILEKSIDVCEENWRELLSYAKEKEIPIGFNVESVAIRKIEIEASIELVKRLQKINKNL